MVRILKIEATRFGLGFVSLIQEIIVKNTFKALVLAGAIATLSTAAFAQSYDQAPASGGSTYQGQSNAFQNAPGPYDNEMGDRVAS
jgi:hypothetical protein